MITKELYENLYSIATAQRFTSQSALELQQNIQQHINPRYSVCLRCSQQLKQGQRLILNWLSQQSVIDENNLMEELMPLPPPEIDIEEAEKAGCTKCRKKKINKQ